MFVATGFVGGKVADLVFQQAETTIFAIQSVFTFTNANIGDEAADRYVIVAIGSEVAVSGRTLSGITIGGSAATVHVTSIWNDPTVETQIASIAGRLVPTGATATIAVTFSGTMSVCWCRVYTMTRYRSSTPTATATQTASEAASVSDTIDIPRGGALLVTAEGDTSTGLSTMVGANEDADENVANRICCSGHIDGLGAQTGRTISVTEAGAADTPDWTMAAAVWQ